VEGNLMERNETFVSAFDRAFVKMTRLVMLKTLCRFGFSPLIKDAGVELNQSAPFIDACLYLNDEIDEVEQEVRFSYKKAYGEDLPADKVEMIKVIGETHVSNGENELDINERLHEFTMFLKGDDYDG
jgi:hypothetical protein